MINKDSKQELDEVVVQAALQQTESQKQAQALAQCGSRFHSGNGYV